MMMRNSGFTLMESVVAGVIFTIAVAGIMATLPAIKSRSTGTDKSFLAARCGQQILESMRAVVDSRDWTDSTSRLSITTHNLVGTALTDYSACAGGVVINATYLVTDAGNGARKVVATVNY